MRTKDEYRQEVIALLTDIRGNLRSIYEQGETIIEKLDALGQAVNVSNIKFQLPTSTKPFETPTKGKPNGKKEDDQENLSSRHTR